MAAAVQLLLCKGPCQLPVTRVCALQVPRSSKQVGEDNDYTLFSVTLFRRVVDTFKSTARTRGFQVGTLAACCRRLQPVGKEMCATQCLFAQPRTN